ncbi:MAG: DUF5640 domain-containing protein [Defluviitaleaceae bacterium]|nr:DUF5640 domain-containing protein [Defluviitaleaceae bacterium]
MKKLLILNAIIIFVLLAGCSAGQDEALIGTWRWDDYGDFSYVFYADGTGFRGLSSDIETFSWSVKGTRLNIDRDTQDGFLRNERWTYTIDGDTLTIVNIHEEDRKYSYIYDSLEQDEELFGVWRWEQFGEYTYIFNEDGTGTRRISDETESFWWSTTGTRLGINRDANDDFRHHERWTYTINNGILTIHHQQEDDVTWSYIYDSMQQDAALVGTWNWKHEDADEENDNAFVYIFNANGTGTRGYPDETESFTWTTTDNHLVIHAPESVHFNFIWERWTYTIRGADLTLDNQEVDGLIYHYTKLL